MSLKISRILHAGYMFEKDQIRILFDPIFENPFSRNCYAFPNVKFDTEEIQKLQLSAIFISHYHDDHCSLESLNLINRQTPIYIYCVHDELFSMLQQMGFRHVYPLQINKPVQIGSWEVIPRRALDHEVDSIFQIKADGLNILNVVDSWIDPETLDLLSKQGSWDMILWPFQTMREIEVLSPRFAHKGTPELPIEWIEQLKVLNPKYLIPSSCQFVQEPWSWYNQALFPISYQKFHREVESILPHTKVIRLNPSKSILLDRGRLNEAASLEWVRPVGDQDVDYQYDPHLKPPSTAHVAIHFPSLTEVQIETVLNYCRYELVERFNSLELPLDSYFHKNRYWRLSLYDHRAQSCDFYYHINEGKLEVVEHPTNSFTWFTEVPLFKLYAALKQGESLTSMYIRINDTRYEPDIEKEIQEVDPIEDPLIQCLFTVSATAFQEAQLHRILKKI